jgi:Domain of unknown function (DUF6265)
MNARINLSVAALGALALGACSSGPKADELGRLGFMVGCWASADGANQEVWSIPRGAIMFGYATTMQGGKLSFFEQSRIDLRNARAAYTASPDGQRPVVFTEPGAATADAVVFENAEHDYPQRISYRKTKAGLAATISRLDGSRPTQYAWVRCKN